MTIEHSKEDYVAMIVDYISKRNRPKIWNVVLPTAYLGDISMLSLAWGYEVDTIKFSDKKTLIRARLR